MPNLFDIPEKKRRRKRPTVSLPATVQMPPCRGVWPGKAYRTHVEIISGPVSKRCQVTIDGAENPARALYLMRSLRERWWKRVRLKGGL